MNESIKSKNNCMENPETGVLKFNQQAEYNATHKSKVQTNI